MGGAVWCADNREANVSDDIAGVRFPAPARTGYDQPFSVVVSRDELQQVYESLLPLIRSEPRLS